MAISEGHGIRRSSGSGANPCLAGLEPLLRRLRENTPLTERAPGSFYLKSKAYLHFHEDAAGIFADVKRDAAGFTRLRATTAQEQAHLLVLVAAHLAR